MGFKIAALMYVSKKIAKQSIWLYIKECAFLWGTHENMSTLKYTEQNF